ncbi:MAG TPA: homoserine kinase [Jatrophihabitantaceae bacterium]|jgi:homoserine kinase
MPKPAFRAGTIHARVPASSANLGPGFDTLGLALALYDDVVARIGDDGLVLDVAGEGADDVPHDDAHLVVRSMRAVFEQFGGQPRGIELVCANRIPHGRGLGSSAAAVAAGVLIGRALVVGGDNNLPDDEVLALAAELEGHPDNVAACLLGGLTVAWTGDDGRVEATRLGVDPAISPVVLIPPTATSTEEARGLLPEQVPHADAAFNVSRSALLMAALSGRPNALLAATDDRLHQSYRADAMPESAALVGKLRAAGLPAVVSGAGPSVLVLARGSAEATAAVAHGPDGWRVESIAVDQLGAHLVR